MFKFFWIFIPNFSNTVLKMENQNFAKKCTLLTAQTTLHCKLPYTAHYLTLHITLHCTLPYTAHYLIKHTTLHYTLHYTSQYSKLQTPVPCTLPYTAHSYSHTAQAWPWSGSGPSLLFCLNLGTILVLGENVWSSTKQDGVELLVTTVPVIIPTLGKINIAVTSIPYHTNILNSSWVG